MAWVVAIGILIVGLMLMPRAIGAAKRSMRGRFGGAAMGFALAFLWAFDPPKAAAMETIQKKKELGEEEAEAEAGGPPSA